MAILENLATNIDCLKAKAIEWFVGVEDLEKFSEIRVRECSIAANCMKKSTCCLGYESYRQGLISGDLCNALDDM